MPAVVLVVVAVTDPGALEGPVSPPAWPSLPLLPALAILLAAGAGLAAPRPPGTTAVRTLRPDVDLSSTKEEVAA